MKYRFVKRLHFKLKVCRFAWFDVWDKLTLEVSGNDCVKDGPICFMLKMGYYALSEMIDKILAISLLA